MRRFLHVQTYLMFEPHLVWRNLYQVEDGTTYEGPYEWCKPLSKCTQAELDIARGLPVLEPDRTPYDFGDW